MPNNRLTYRYLVYLSCLVICLFTACASEENQSDSSTPKMDEAKMPSNIEDENTQETSSNTTVATNSTSTSPSNEPTTPSNNPPPTTQTIPTQTPNNKLPNIITKEAKPGDQSQITLIDEDNEEILTINIPNQNEPSTKTATPSTPPVQKIEENNAISTNPAHLPNKTFTPPPPQPPNPGELGHTIPSKEKTPSPLPAAKPIVLSPQSKPIPVKTPVPEITPPAPNPVISKPVAKQKENTPPPIPPPSTKNIKTEVPEPEKDPEPIVKVDAPQSIKEKPTKQIQTSIAEVIQPPAPPKPKPEPAPTPPPPAPKAKEKPSKPKSKSRAPIIPKYSKESLADDLELYSSPANRKDRIAVKSKLRTAFANSNENLISAVILDKEVNINLEEFLNQLSTAGACNIVIDQLELDKDRKIKNVSIKQTEKE